MDMPNLCAMLQLAGHPGKPIKNPIETPTRNTRRVRLNLQPPAPPLALRTKPPLKQVAYNLKLAKIGVFKCAWQFRGGIYSSLIFKG